MPFTYGIHVMISSTTELSHSLAAWYSVIGLGAAQQMMMMMICAACSSTAGSVT